MLDKHYQAIAVLLGAGGDVNKIGHEGQTALMKAARAEVAGSPTHDKEDILYIWPLSEMLGSGMIVPRRRCETRLKDIERVRVIISLQWPS